MDSRKLTSGLGVETFDKSIYDVLIDEANINDVICQTKSKNVDLIPSNSDLCGLEIELLSFGKKEYLLKNKLEISVRYEYILIDCPPSQVY